MSKHHTNPNHRPSAKQLTRILQKCHGHERPRRYEALSQTGGDEGDVTTKLMWGPGFNPGPGKRHQWENYIRSRD